MEINYPEIGICGLSCRLCPHYQAQAASRCPGCKSAERIRVGCPFITCALKKKGIEFCWDCPEHGSCEKWAKHRELGRKVDSFKCYQALEDDIDFIQFHGTEEFEKQQVARESLLTTLLDDYNEGRSKSYYCIAATIMKIEELEHALAEAAGGPPLMDAREKAKKMHAILDRIAREKGYLLRLRK